MCGDLQEILVEHQTRLLRRIESRIGLNPFVDFSAEDVLQEAFADAHRGLVDLRATHEHAVSAWLNRIVDNRISQMMRDRSRAKRGGRISHVATAGSSMGQLARDLQDNRNETGSARLLRKEIEVAIGEAIGRLPSHQQSVVQQYYIEQHSLDDIADSKSMSKSAVRSILYRARIAIRNVLGNSSKWFKDR